MSKLTTYKTLPLAPKAHILLQGQTKRLLAPTNAEHLPEARAKSQRATQPLNSRGRGTLSAESHSELNRSVYRNPGRCPALYPRGDSERLLNPFITANRATLTPSSSIPKNLMVAVQKEVSNHYSSPPAPNYWKYLSLIHI